ncbi:MAG TPA: hypothetical protein VNS88_00685 [Nitrospiraceae bacterium]|nr:hypothetical protein [Nitrospiraceae bacterium]
MDGTRIPQDLVPLPTAPYEERPASLPLDVEECRTALWLERGNIPDAAARLKVTPIRLRNFVQNSPRLLAEQREAREQLADRAEKIVYEALHDEVDSSRRDSMAKYVLNSVIGKTRGFGSAGVGVKIQNTGPMVITWATEDDGIKTINEEGEVVESR